MANRTEQQFWTVIEKCKDIFYKKSKDYGTAWLILRPQSLTDQIFIKAQRLRTIEDKGTQMVSDRIEDEYVGIINYCIMALIQYSPEKPNTTDISAEEALQLYNTIVEHIFDLLNNKNHDYGEAWRDMRVSSFTDLILMKLLRIKQIEDNAGKTLISEGVESGYQDIVNYSVFALIKISEQ